MEENLTNQTLEEYDVTEDVKIEEIDVSVEDVEAEISVEETIDDVIVEPEEEVVIDISESMGWVGGDSRYHDSLLGIELPNQHPIAAITGLRAELDEIETLKTVYSDKMGIANYYAWNEGVYNEHGYFVSLVPHSSTIKICEGEDIFGVTVDVAGFVGGQDATVPRNKNNKYALVATSGLVDVRCESTVVEGEYVISNARGIAEKTTSGCGYKVIAVNDDRTHDPGVLYATIALGVQACATDALGKSLQDVKGRVDINEKNIVSAINVANQAYRKSTEASESSSVSEEAVKEALEAVLKAEKNIEDFEKVLESTSNVAVQAKAIADSAVTSTTTLTNEAIARANDAWSKADNVETEAHSLCAKIDKYSVGEYSQAYGLTLEQAQSILEIGIVYVPTKHIDTGSHREEYSYNKDGVVQTYEREFTPGYLYQWDYIANGDINIGWLTVGESPSVYFSSVEPIANDRLAYWYTDGDVITDIDGNTDTYEPYALYKWEEDHWLAVATLKGNVSNRAVSEIYQTTNEIMLGVTNPRGCIAALDARLTDTEARITSATEWAKGEDDSGNELRNLATIDQSADQDGSSIALVVADVQGNKVLNGANIVLGQDGEDSFISMDAERILLTGEVTLASWGAEDDKTVINGGKIQAKSITAEQISVTDLSALEATIGGWTITEQGLSKNTTKLLTDDTVVDYSLVYDGAKMPIRLAIGGTSKRHDEYDYAVRVQEGYVYETINFDDGIITNISINLIEDEEGDTYYDDTQVVIAEDGRSFSISFRHRYYQKDCDASVLCNIEYFDLRDIEWTEDEYKFRLLEDGSLYASAVKLGDGMLGSDDSVFLSTTDMGGVTGFFDGTSTKNWRMTVGSKFGVTSAGKLYAKEADITGVVTAESGSISRWDINRAGITGIAYPPDSTTSTRINVGLSPGNKGDSYYFYDNNHETVSLFVGTNASVVETGGKVDANFMVYADGKAKMTTIVIGDTDATFFTSAEAKQVKMTINAVTYRYKSANSTSTTTYQKTWTQLLSS